MGCERKGDKYTSGTGAGEAMTMAAKRVAIMAEKRILAV